MQHLPKLSLIEAYEEKLRLLEQMLKITGEQLSELENAGDEINLDGIAKRQSVIDEINKLDEYIKAIKTGPADNKDGLDAFKQKALETLKSIQKMDKRITAIMDEKLSEYKAAIQNVGESKKGLKAYSEPVMPADGIYFDKKQ